MTKALELGTQDTGILGTLRGKITGASQTHLREFDIHLGPPGKPFVQGNLEAGVAETDITPHPGIPKGGYAAMAKEGQGFRGRIKARAFYIKPAKGQSVCLLQADLHAGSAVIRNKVAELVASETDLNPANICLTCTHTHSGPGQLLESNFYNKFASHKPGFDFGLFEFICQRIANAVIEAFRTKAPAKISSGAIDVYGLTRNRSMVPFLNNLGQGGDAKDENLKYQAINPKLHLLRFDVLADDGTYYPKGIFSNFSIHGTCIPANNELYSSDSWHYLSRSVERYISSNYKPPWKVIHGPSQGTHGDIAPDVADKHIGFPEAKRIGNAIAEKTIELFKTLDTACQDNVVVRNGLRKVDVYESPAIKGVSIAKRPVVGNALTAGAYEHSTPVLYHLPFFKHGMGSARFFFPDPEQGYKRKLGGKIQDWILPKEEFPHELLFQTIQIGDFVLVGVPFEVSVKAGEEIAAKVSEATGNVKQICVASLTNGYTGYTTTKEEYEKQFYEGGHTLYGPNTNRYISENCFELMKDTMDSDFIADIPSVWHYSMQCSQYFKYRTNIESETEAHWISHPIIKTTAKGEICVCASLKERSSNRIDWNSTLVEIQIKIGDRWETWVDEAGDPVNDFSSDIEVQYVKGKYQIAWYFQGVRTNSELRFVWNPGALKPSVSSAFSLKNI